MSAAAEFRAAATAAVAGATSRDEAARLIADIAARFRVANIAAIPRGPLEQAVELDDGFIIRPHLTYINDRITAAMERVEAGESAYLVVSLPPRMGKSTLLSRYLTNWGLRKHPDWPFALISHEDELATGWGREVRRTVEAHPEHGVAIAPDAGAVRNWETTNGGVVRSRGIRSSLTGRGVKVMIIDDPIKDFVEAHSAASRQLVWDWWLSVAQLRFEPPVLVVAVMTRWHQDDFIGRLLSTDTEGDPSDWEVITIPAIAEKGDLLGREPGEPLLSPIIEETPEQALARWDKVRRDVGTYVFQAMYLQRPSPARGSVFDADWWRYWTRDPGHATDDGKVLFWQPEDHMKTGRWLDSWDMAFKDTDGSDYVVGQRWTRQQANRFLVNQIRARMNFTTTLKAVEAWADPTSLCGTAVHERLVEDKANGPAIITSLRDHISGIIPINPKTSKEARARAITPEVESGNVYLPYPGDPGNEWVHDLLSELRNFPHDVHDDQVDALTQALDRLRGTREARIGVPGRQGPGLTGRSITQTALAQRRVLPPRDTPGR